MGPIFFDNGSGTAASSIVNSGTITGITGFGGGSAIQFLPGSAGNTLTLGTTSVINGNVLGAGSDILQLGGIGTGTFNVSDIGAGQQYQGFSTFNKVGLSNWTLTGSGAQNWTISQGALVGDTNSLQGSQITNNATLVFDQSSTGTYAGSISGSGSLGKSGVGELIMTGANTYTGATAVVLGQLTVDGSLVSTVLVSGAGATLAGVGAVGSTTIAGGGTLSPGHNGFGTLTVNGSLSLQTGSVYLFGVSNSGAGFTQVNGSANIESGAFAAAAFQGSTFNSQYTILSATGGVTGTFQPLLSNSAVIKANLS